MQRAPGEESTSTKERFWVSWVSGFRGLGFRVLGPRGNRTVESPSLYPNGRLIAGKDQFSAR